MSLSARDALEIRGELLRPWSVVACAGLGAALCFFSATSMNVLLPSVTAALKAGPVMAQWIMLGYWIATAACLLAFGRLADLYGRKRIFCCGLVVFCFASVMSAAAPSASMLVLARVLQGAAAAAIFANTSALVAQVYSGPRLGAALGNLATVAALAQAVGPGAGAWIAEHWGWRSVSGTAAVTAAIVFSFAIRQLPSDTRASGRAAQPFDGPSALLAGGALAVLCWGLTELSRGAIRNRGGSALLGPVAAVALTVLLLTMLWRRMHRVQHPLIAPRLLRDRVKAGVYVSTFAVGMLQQGPLVILAIYLQIGRGMSVADSGLQLSGMALGMMFGAVCAGQCARFWPAQRLCMMAMGWMLAALVATLLCLFGQTDQLLALALGLLGFGVAFFVTPSNHLLMQNCPADHRGVVNALRAAIQNAGVLSGIAWLMLTMSLALPTLARGSVPADHAGAGLVGTAALRDSMSAAFAALAAMLIAGMLSAAHLWKPRSRTNT